MDATRLDGTPQVRPWWLYMLECTGGRIYTGIALDVDRRYTLHAAGRGAQFTRMYPPVRILVRVPYADRANAARAEIAMKRLKAQDKWRWVTALSGSASAISGLK